MGITLETQFPDVVRAPSLPGRNRMSAWVAHSPVCLGVSPGLWSRGQGSWDVSQGNPQFCGCPEAPHPLLHRLECGWKLTHTIPAIFPFSRDGIWMEVVKFSENWWTCAWVLQKENLEISNTQVNCVLSLNIEETFSKVNRCMLIWAIVQDD